jgi:eukaryotic-like serine/threonine-protein kinase
VSIVHRDLKPENVLLSEKLTGPKTKELIVKLGDVGLAALRADPTVQTVRHATTKVGKAGTYPYIAPETLLQGKCTPASDIFSLALLMWELIEGEIPFHDMPNLDGMLPILWQDGRRPPMESANFEQVCC